MRPLGKNQLERLLGLASPGSLLVVGGDPVSRSLVARGFLAPRLPNDRDAWLGITPSGMRALADAFEAGKLDQFFKKFPPDKADATLPSALAATPKQSHAMPEGVRG